MRVQLFPTCLVNEIRPDAGMAVARVLERVGCEVVLPEGLTCCGQPAYNAGFHDEARQVARHAIEVLAATEGPIVVPSGSCCDMLVHQNVELFRDDAAVAAAAERVSARCREFSQFVVERGGVPGGSLPSRVAYHPSCHLQRGLRVQREPLQLIGGVAGAESIRVRRTGRVLRFRRPLLDQERRDLRRDDGPQTDGDRGVGSQSTGQLRSRMSAAPRRRPAPPRRGDCGQHLAEFLDEAAT